MNQKDPRQQQIDKEVDEREPGPCPDDFGREPTAKPKPRDPRAGKAKTRRGPAL